MKTCTNPDCKEVNPQPLSNFHGLKRTKDGLTQRCKSCRSAQTAAHYWANRDIRIAKNKAHYKKFPRKRKGERLRDKYWPNLTWEEALQKYDEMFKKQDGKCLLCNRDDSETFKGLVVDHRHKDGVVRGLLCSDCNRAIGLLQDSSIIAYKVAKYLERPV